MSKENDIADLLTPLDKNQRFMALLSFAIRVIEKDESLFNDLRIQSEAAVFF